MYIYIYIHLDYNNIIVIVVIIIIIIIIIITFIKHHTRSYRVAVFRGTLTIRALVMGDGVPCYGALEIVGLLLLLLLQSR